MAATIATAWGEDSTRTKETHRLGSRSATAEAATWNTFAQAFVNKNGSGYISVRQHGKLLARVTFGPEDETTFVRIEGKDQG